VPVANQVELADVLARGEPERVVGTRESSWLDFKRDPHSLDSNLGKWEFLKDVVALANARGGLLVCGIKAEREPHEAAERAVSLWPFRADKVNADQLKQLVRDLVQPSAVIDLHWYEHPPGLAHTRDPADPDAQYLVISVDPISEQDRYAVLRRTITADGKLVEGVAVPVRHDDGIRWLRADELYRLINDGYRARYTNVSAPIGISDEAPPVPDEAIDSLERSQEWNDVPSVFLQSIPRTAPSILPGWPSDIRGAISQGNVLRPMGFHLFNPYEEVEQVGDSLQVSDRRMALRVSMRGVVTGGALATEDFLGWAMRSQGHPGRINVIPLTEIFLEFFRFADEIVLPRTPGGWLHRVVARRLATADPPVILGEGPNPTFPRRGRFGKAAADNWEKAFPATGTVERDAYLALQQFYALFGLSVDTNPFVEGDRLSTHKFLTAVTES
jgi:hypothetical protein